MRERSTTAVASALWQRIQLPTRQGTKSGQPTEKKREEKNGGQPGGAQTRPRRPTQRPVRDKTDVYGVPVTVLVSVTAGKNDEGSGDTQHDTTGEGEGDGTGSCLTGGGGAAATHVPRRRGKGTTRSGRHGSGHAQRWVAEARPTQVPQQRQCVGGRLCPPPLRLPPRRPRALLWPERTAHSRHCRSSQWQRGGGGDDWQLGPTGARPGGCPRFGSLQPEA